MGTSRRKLSDDEVRQLMIPKIVDALYPVLIPVEQQCMEIQARNRKHVEQAAEAAWSAFVSGTTPAPEKD